VGVARSRRAKPVGTDRPATRRRIGCPCLPGGGRFGYDTDNGPAAHLDRPRAKASTT
jgi:hypothetical protein